ncbi:MAG: molybdopterin-dependent oxidoreductase [Granulosicoccus sp.]
MSTVNDTALTNDAEIRVQPSVCPLDCPDTCSLSLTTQGDNVISVKGSKANPYTAGVICNKVARYYPGWLHGPARLTQPLRRTGPRGSGQYAPVTWNEALDLVHAGLSRAIDQYGPQSVLPLNYAGPHGQLAGGSMDLRFFHRLGASLLNRGPLCGIVRGTAYTSLFGDSPGMPPEQAENADTIVVWGNNVTVSNLHFTRIIKAAREQGATLVVIDPKRTRIAEQADLYLQPRPGADVVLAMAVAAELEKRAAFDTAFIEQWVEGLEPFMAQARQYNAETVQQCCGISADAFNALVDTYATARTLATSVGNGIERGHSGGSGLRAIMSLNALLGQHGRPGAGVVAKQGLSFPSTPARLQRPDLVPEGTRTLNIVDVGRHLLTDDLDPPIRAAFIYNHNPVCTHPDQNRMRRALSREEIFIAGCDVVMNDSLAYADVILPGASFAESHDIYAAYGQAWLQRAAPAIAPVGQSLPNTEIFRRIAARFGFVDEAFQADDMRLMDDAFDGNDPRMQGFAPSRLPLDKALPMTADGTSALVMCDTIKPSTSSGKIELFSTDLEDRFGFGVPRFDPVDHRQPLTIISPSSSRRTNSSFGESPDSQAAERLEIHPDDATARNITDGQTVRVFNELGEVTLVARLTDAVPAGVLYTPKGTWLATSLTGQTVNSLISADLKTDIAEGACYNDTWVNVAPA